MKALNLENSKMLIKLNTQKLLNISKLLKEFNTEAKIKFNQEGLKIIEMDLSNVSLLDISLTPGEFIIYEGLEEEKTFKVNVDILYKILREQKKTEVSISLNESKSHLEFNFNNGIKSMLCLLDMEGERIKEKPGLEYTTSIIIQEKPFKEAIKHLSNIKESIKFIVDNNTTQEGIFKNIFKMEAKTPLNEGYIDFKREDYIINGYSAEANFSTEYLKKFIKGNFFKNSIKLNWNNDYPLSIEGQEKGLKVIFILAPRIEGED